MQCDAMRCDMETRECSPQLLNVSQLLIIYIFAIYVVHYRQLHVYAINHSFVQVDECLTPQLAGIG